MRFFTLLFLLLSYQSFSQKKILIQSIRISNNYEEVSTNPFNKQENETAFLHALEKGLIEKFGEATFKYLGYKKILVLDKVIANNPHQIAIAYQDLYRAKRETNLKDYDVLVDVKVDINDFFKGRKDNLEITSKIKATDNSKKKLFKNKAILNLSINPIAFTEGQFIHKEAKIYEGFPLNEEKLMVALISGIQKACALNKSVEEQTVTRHEFNEYANFIDKSTSYQVLARNDFAQWAYKFKILKILTFAKYRPAIVKRQEDNQQVLLGLRERTLTDIPLNFRIPGVFQTSNLHKFFILWSQTASGPAKPYFLQTVVTDNQVLGVVDLYRDLKFNLKNEKHQNVGEFKYRLQGGSSERVLNYAYSLNLVYHPFSVLEGTLHGKEFTMSTNPYTLNAVEIRWNGQLAGLITHAAASKKYIRKRKNMLPYYLYFNPEISEEDQQLLLQTFQAFHLAQALQNERDISRNM